jgi:glycosyltransferase involved in cell wall biosynthesis
VVSLARIDPLKDIETLLEAAALVRRELPDVRFKLYGDVWNEEYFNSCLALHGRLELDGCFEFAGHTESPATAYQEGDVVVLSSISEAFPYAVVEAMMCGRPVVATSVGGVGEALSDCGLTVEPRNPDALAQSCLKLLGDRKLRESMGKRALSRARSQFTINEMAGAYESIYQAAAADCDFIPVHGLPEPRLAGLAV